MRRFRSIDVTRVFLATAILIGSVGTSPMFGHAHETADADHDHHDWSAHEHDYLASHHESGMDGCSSVESGNAVFHLHGTWCWIPFSVPAPAGNGKAHVVVNPLAMAVLLPAVTVGVDQFGSI